MFRNKSFIIIIKILMLYDNDIKSNPLHYTRASKKITNGDNCWILFKNTLTFTNCSRKCSPFRSYFENYLSEVL